MTVSGTPVSPPSTPMAALLPGLSNGSGATETTSIKVFCRLRQQNQLEKREGATECSTVVDQRTIFLRNERCDVDEIRCTFDRVFDVQATQQEVYEHTAMPLVSDFLQGYNCTIFAYGQTGSGKTHTILGPKDGVLVKSDEEGGIISRVVKDIFKEVATTKCTTETAAPEAGELMPAAALKRGVTVPNAPGETVEFTVSFVEIYMEQIRDLLAAGGGNSTNATAAAAAVGGLKIRENAQKGIFIEDMTQVHAPTEHATMELVKTGTLNRAVSSTRMNKDSSRSHSILIITCTRKALKGAVLKRSTMYIVDLAGSEFVNKTNAAGKVLQEAKAINKSLSALSNVIKALVEGKKHVPYRDSKLTRILQDSLGGAAKTCLILAASCSSYNMSETISTLRFGLRAKEIKNPAMAQRNDSATSGIGPGGIFKELYQQAMAELEEKNKKIDELQHLLSAVVQENQQLAEREREEQQEQLALCEDEVSCVDVGEGNGGCGLLDQLEPSWLDPDSESCDVENTEDVSGDVAGQMIVDACVDNGSGSEDEDEDEEDDNSVALELALREKEEIAQRATTLADENKRLFHVLEALESQLDQVAVDLASGRPVLRLRTLDAAQSPPPTQQQAELSSHDAAPALSMARDPHLLSLKLWLQSDKWQQALGHEPNDAAGVETASTTSTATSTSSQRSVTVHPLSKDAEQRFSPPKYHQPTSLNLNLSVDTDDADVASTTALDSSFVSCASNTGSTPCVHRIDAEALSRQIVELKLQLHYVTESTKQALDGESHALVLESAKLKTRIEELEFQASLRTVACNQLERTNRACETRLSNQETHIGCLQNSLQEYQGLFKQQIIMSQEKCRLLTDELEFYKKLAKCSQPGALAHLCGSGAGSPVSPLKTSPSPRKHRLSGGGSLFASAVALTSTSTSSPSMLPAPVKPNPVSTMLFPELEYEMNSSAASPVGSSSASSDSNAFGLWRSFGSLYRPSTSKTALSSDVEIELAEKPTAAARSPLSVKMSRPIVKPIGAPAVSAAAIATMPSTTTSSAVEQMSGNEATSYSPWIVRGFRDTSMRTMQIHAQPDATLDELAGPIEMPE